MTAIKDVLDCMGQACHMRGCQINGFSALHDAHIQFHVFRSFRSAYYLYKNKYQGPAGGPGQSLERRVAVGNGTGRCGSSPAAFSHALKAFKLCDKLFGSDIEGFCHPLRYTVLESRVP